MQPLSQKDPFFTYFNTSIHAHALPIRFTSPFDAHPQPHPLAILAATQLQNYLSNQQEWKHDFGLSPLSEYEKGITFGKMFGILVVQTLQNDIGYLAAFSGKLAGGNHHAAFVPPVFDSLAEDSFLNTGMATLAVMNNSIRLLHEQKLEVHEAQIAMLKEQRKMHSATLQEKLFDAYHFLNQSGEEKSLREIFKHVKRPPAGAGECAAPKLLHYAFQHQMKPITMAEFWWGISLKSEFRKHRHFYPSCLEKCEPILKHMLKGIALEERRV